MAILLETADITEKSNLHYVTDGIAQKISYMSAQTTDIWVDNDRRMFNDTYRQLFTFSEYKR